MKVASRILDVSRTPQPRQRSLYHKSTTLTEELSYDQGIHEVTNGSYVLLFIENRGNLTLYITVLDLLSTWAVEQTYTRGPSTEFDILGPYSTLDLPIGISMGKAPFESIDVIKVYATAELTSFHSLQLPHIDEGLSIQQLQKITASPRPTSDGRGTTVPSPDTGSILTSEKRWATSQVTIRTIDKV